MLLANFTTVRPEMGRLFCSCKTPLIAGKPFNLANNNLGYQQPNM